MFWREKLAQDSFTVIGKTVNTYRDIDEVKASSVLQSYDASYLFTEKSKYYFTNIQQAVKP